MDDAGLLEYVRRASEVLSQVEWVHIRVPQRDRVPPITDADWSTFAAKSLIRSWWAKCCPGRKVSVYCGPVKSVVALAKYLAKDLISRNVEMPPTEWDGRICRFVRTSNGYLVMPKKEVWRKLRAQWYPKISSGTQKGERLFPIDITDYAT